MKFKEIKHEDIASIDIIIHNRLFLINFKNGEKYFFKLDNTRNYPRKDNFSKDLCAYREVISYKVSNIFDFINHPIVEPTIIDGVCGSLIQFIKGVSLNKFIQNNPNSLNFNKIKEIALFDWIIGNCDRIFSNIIVDSFNNYWVIDNEFCFPEKSNCGNVYGYLSYPHLLLINKNDLNLPKNLLSYINDKNKKHIINIISEINDKAVDLFEERWEYLVKNKKLPNYKYDKDGYMISLQ